MRPDNLKTKIFLDGGDPTETQEALRLLGFLDGQTTNPTLIVKHPEAKARLERGEKFTKEELYGFYRTVVKELSDLIPAGSISIEVYADKNTTAEEMLNEGREMFSWIPGAHIKFPTTREGLQAAAQAVKEGLRVNMTLCFTQAQAAAVYSATRGAQKGQVFVSPFVGRLDDQGERGMDLIANILRMYKSGDGHVEVLTASVRNSAHLIEAFALRSDIVTAPFKVLKEWAQAGMLLDGEAASHPVGSLKPIPYEEIDLSMPWETLDISHELTDKGMERFSQDWNSLLKG